MLLIDLLVFSCQNLCWCIANTLWIMSVIPSFQKTPWPAPYPPFKYRCCEGHWNTINKQLCYQASLKRDTSISTQTVVLCHIRAFWTEHINSAAAERSVTSVFWTSSASMSWAVIIIHHFSHQSLRWEHIWNFNISYNRLSTQSIHMWRIY